MKTGVMEMAVIKNFGDVERSVHPFHDEPQPGVAIFFVDSNSEGLF
jgi:hypothetical protein